MGRKRHPSMTGSVYHLSAEENTLRQMPKYYPACRCGVIGDTHYNRRHAEADLRRLLEEER